MGKHPQHINRSMLIGGNAIITLDHWASKVNNIGQDNRGHGTYTSTTYQGRNGKKLTLICAYISVLKGSMIGNSTVHAQQTMLMEIQAKKDNKILHINTCPRKEAIKEISKEITRLQKEGHAIVLMIDANQASKECFTRTNTVKPFSIEWLRYEHGLDDTFVTLYGSRPPTTTIHPNRDIDYVYTWGVHINRISTQDINNPASSDHLGICFDINLHEVFGGTYGLLAPPTYRKLTVKNIQAKTSYIKYIAKQWGIHKLHEKATALYNIAKKGHFTHDNYLQLQALDNIVTQILLSGEDKCAKHHRQHNPWSPELCQAGKQITYWKRKLKMARKKCFKWYILEKDRIDLNIKDEDHYSREEVFIKQKLREARQQWKKVRKNSDELRKQYMMEQAEEYAAKHNMTTEQALRAIMNAEQSRRTYQQIRSIVGHKKEKNALTEVDILDPNFQDGRKMTLTNPEEVEEAIRHRNQKHARQSLQTPLASNPFLAEDINPENSNNKIHQFLNGEYLNNNDQIGISDIEKQWIQELSKKMEEEIDTYIDIQDFIKFFKAKKEKTASSLSGRHIGHYKVIATMAEEGNTDIAETLILLANISIMTSQPLHRWQHSMQVMLDKGKGKYIEHLRIIQLCEADLNFILHVIWGDRMIRNAIKSMSMDDMQCALPGQTCHSATWNKVLYCDLMRQTETQGIMTDYDAAAAFDRVLHTTTIVTCRRFGIPQHACQFIYTLLQNMEFHVTTGFGVSSIPFHNKADPTSPGQGMLQGSSSAAPIYSVNSDVTLSANRKLAAGACFKHPITGEECIDYASQYVDDKTEMVNTTGLQLQDSNKDKQRIQEYIFEAASNNTNIWTQLMWMSGGKLNSEKCFYYYIEPEYDFKSQTTKYKTIRNSPGIITITDPSTKEQNTLNRIEPSTARRTLGVILAPNGNHKDQIGTCIEKASVFLGKMRHSNLSQHAKWTAITSVLEPGILYPLMATICPKKELDKIERIIIRAKCNALGLNEHFPRAILYGPHCYGGLAIPSVHASNMITRVNYFLFHIRLNTKVGMKLETSVAYLQLEIGLCQPFLTAPYELYKDLATTTLLKCIWAETEPFGITIKPHKTCSWTPEVQGPYDKSIMEIARAIYCPNDCIMINRVRLYLQVITIYDLMIYNGQQLHPELLQGKQVASRNSTMYWVEFKKPPPRYFTVWKNFLKEHIKPLILSDRNIEWYSQARPRYHTTYYYSHHNGSLYQKKDETYLCHLVILTKRLSSNKKFHLTPTSMQITELIKLTLQPVEVMHTSTHIQLLCNSNINSHGKQKQSSTSSNQPQYRLLPKELRRICGKVKLPPDGGTQLIEYLHETDASLVGVSDASVNNGNGTHAWILSTGESQHLDNPYMKVEGNGPVDGHPIEMNSARGELQGQTALAIMSRAILTQNNATDIPVILTCDNKGVQTNCNNNKNQRIKDHRESNMDLTMEYESVKKDITLKSEWVKGHQDKDLKWSSISDLQELKLSNMAKLNILCDRNATEAQQHFTSDPEGEVLPSEKWAVFTTVPQTRKITGKLKQAILQTLYHDNLLDFIYRKHGLTEAKLEHIDTQSLGTVIKKSRVHNRASLSKLIHRWIPTNALLHKQQRASTPECPRCMKEHETATHTLQCQDKEAITARSMILYEALTKLSKMDTCPLILATLEDKLTETLQIPSQDKYVLKNQEILSLSNVLIKARRNQNIIGWDMLLRGFSSKLWHTANLNSQTPSKSQGKHRTPWQVGFVGTMLNINKAIWTDRNTFMHGKTTIEARQKARQAVLKKVKEIYQQHPKLAKRYPDIKQIPLEERLKKNTSQLLDWFVRLEHQIKMSKLILSHRPPGQKTLREAYSDAGMFFETNKYPP